MDEDRFCPRHGRSSRPIEIPGLKCDCPETPKGLTPFESAYAALPPAVVITASQIDRLLRCPGGASLLSVEDSDDTEAADEGTNIHAEILLSDDAQPEHSFFWEWLHGEVGQHGGLSATEYAFSMSPVGASCLGRLDAHRDYPVPVGLPWLVAGTADAHAISYAEDGSVVIRVADLKTGHDQIFGGALPDPEESGQLKTLTTLIWNSIGCPDKVNARLAWACWDDAEKRGWMVEAQIVFTADHLRLWDEELRALAERIVSGRDRDKFVRGSHCRYCNGFELCPSQREALAKIGRYAEITNKFEDLRKLADDEISDLWVSLKAAEAQVALARQTLTTFVERIHEDHNCGLPVGQGKELVPARNLMRFVKNVPAIKDLAEANGRDVKKLVKETITIGAINSVWGKEAETFLTEMEQVGYIEKRPTKAFLRERKIK